MTKPRPHGLCKAERLHSRTLIDTLFNGGVARAMTVYPLRAVYMPAEDRSQMLVSVPKRLFKRAVKRNRAKRLVREAYRHYKQLIADGPMTVAFIWISERPASARTVEGSMRKILLRMNESRPGTASEPAERKEGGERRG